MTVPTQDPFQDPVTPPSTFPTQASFRGRVIMITAHKIETVPNQMNPGTMQERITADVTVVDGRGPVPQMKNNAHTGQFLEGPDFTGVWFNGTRVVDQLRATVGTGQKTIGIMETYKPGQVPVKGNPWGILAASDEQKQAARQFLAGRTVAAAIPPVAAPAPGPILAPQYPAPVAAPAPAPAPVAAPAPAMPQAPAPGSAPAGVNPFA